MRTQFNATDATMNFMHITSTGYNALCEVDVCAIRFRGILLFESSEERTNDLTLLLTLSKMEAEN